jgi:hypothetical protein
MPIRGRVMSIWIVAAAFVTVLLLLVAARHFGRSRVIASAVAPDGTEMCMVQQCNWGPELFTTSFVYRKPGANWGRFYYDHEDGYWRTSRVVLHTNNATAMFYRDEAPAVTFRWETETYTLHRFDRTLTGAQFSLPAGWSPKQSVYSRGAQR